MLMDLQCAQSLVSWRIKAQMAQFENGYWLKLNKSQKKRTKLQLQKKMFIYTFFQMTESYLILLSNSFRFTLYHRSKESEASNQKFSKLRKHVSKIVPCSCNLTSLFFANCDRETVSMLLMTMLVMVQMQPESFVSTHPAVYTCSSNKLYSSIFAVYGNVLVMSSTGRPIGAKCIPKA